MQTLGDKTLALLDVRPCYCSLNFTNVSNRSVMAHTLVIIISGVSRPTRLLFIHTGTAVTRKISKKINTACSLTIYKVTDNKQLTKNARNIVLYIDE